MYASPTILRTADDAWTMGMASENSVLIEGISCASLTESRRIGPTFNGSPRTVNAPTTSAMRPASPVLPYPTRPIVENTLADLGPFALERNDQPCPDFFGRESVARKSILNVDIPLFWPVVAGRIPDQESTISVCINDQPGTRWSAGLSGPAFVQSGICALEAPAIPCIRRQGETQRRRLVPVPFHTHALAWSLIPTTLGVSFICCS